MMTVFVRVGIVAKRYGVRPTDEQRERLDDLLRKGTASTSIDGRGQLSGSQPWAGVG
jgi:hypothetical protein